MQFQNKGTRSRLYLMEIQCEVRAESKCNLTLSCTGLAFGEPVN